MLGPRSGSDSASDGKGIVANPTLLPQASTAGVVLGGAGGTWVSDEPGALWTRLKLYEDGTCEVWSAMPSADNWGKGTKGRWRIETGKYVDTGKRYYRLALLPPSGKEATLVHYMDGIWVDKGTIRWGGRGGRSTMTRGDRPPFSR